MRLICKMENKIPAERCAGASCPFPDNSIMRGQGLKVRGNPLLSHQMEVARDGRAVDLWGLWHPEPHTQTGFHCVDANLQQRKQALIWQYNYVFHSARLYCISHISHSWIWQISMAGSLTGSTLLLFKTVSTFNPCFFSADFKHSLDCGSLWSMKEFLLLQNYFWTFLSYYRPANS